MAAEKVQLTLISDTHWDREWNDTFQNNRMDLVECLDSLLAVLDKDPNYQHYVIDGQTLCVEDYLEMRPENREKFIAYVKQGRIAVGPWYSLVDEVLVSGESLVRNLLTGTRLAKELGGVMKVGYSVSSFGHISQLPQLYDGFGIDSIIFYRGINRYVCPGEFLWEAPDGTQKLALRLSDKHTRQNYFYLLYRPLLFGQCGCWNADYSWGKMGLPTHCCDPEMRHEYFHLLQQHYEYDPAKLPELFAQLRADAAEDATTPMLLFWDGCDSSFPNPITTRIVADINKFLPQNEELVHGNLTDYIKKLRKHLPADMAVVKGEMRWTNKDGLINHLFQNVANIRPHIKQQNHQCQLELTSWTEPYAIFARALGVPYPDAFMKLAWKLLLANHQHDSICGCGTDLVYEDMQYRFRQVKTLAQGMFRRSAESILERIDQSQAGPRDLAITVFNPSPFTRTETLPLTLDLHQDLNISQYRIFDAQGKELPYGILSEEKAVPILKSRHEMKLNIYTTRQEVLFPAENIPPCGYRTFYLRPVDGFVRHPESLVTGPNQMENQHLRATIHADGTLDLVHKASGKILNGVHYFEDCGDKGHFWVFNPPIGDKRLTSHSAETIVTLEHDTAVEAQYKIVKKFLLPKGLAKQRSERDCELVECRIETLVTLGRSSERLEFLTTVNNQAENHRLRVVFPTGINAQTADAESQFDVVTRPVRPPDTRDWREPMPGTQTMVSFVDVHDDEAGLALLSKGIYQYEVLADEQHSLVLTLFRAVGTAAEANMAEVLINVEPEEPPASQLLFPMTFQYALYPHTGDWVSAGVEHQARAHETPFRAMLSMPHQGDMPSDGSFFQLEGEGLALSAIKKSADRKSVIVRLYNPTDEPRSARLRFLAPLKSARLVTLNEKPIEPLKVGKGNTIALKVPHKKIVSIEVEL